MPDIKSQGELQKESLVRKGTYTGEVECGPCKFQTVAIFKEMEKNQYNVSVSIKNKGSISCPIKEYQGPAEITDNGNGTLTAKGMVPYFKVEVEQTVPVTKTSDNSLSIATSLFGLFKLNARVKPEATRVIESRVSANDQSEVKSNLGSMC
ncbi:hypothetical protein [Legionella longbeachae]|uniref:Uncharacterized protein n=1 Tax=Legionella longbeachae serogroup 1 (strain NSW150) TaxID=661367 RepID=D3HRX0_LEGLN|nr:hypothetical protein [Legionella longbeachae]VEE02152.1 Uncharacterised protein [Legionella oakridgensis]HBD7396604.1 hypothetical protein [Legionella pneumophila]ARB91546.1 hypothetical protein A6J40_04800 [Legionella longbeachae]EEZ95222.1 hypothetical protein LLB_0382 [Legionella longbeachae D-4968]QIN32036.1 hypothetical protein GCB94_07690 [Legionella longbeachae]